ncbi:hypothetical protein NQ315_009978, partial [Exocentrus adspersus]
MENARTFRRMRRPPGLWILLSAGVLWLSLQDAYGLRATSLIFGKTTTTTTTSTTAKATSEEAAAAAEEEVSECSVTSGGDLGNDPNATKPTLTGNPQVDYIWDPNLPKELNGYNLSDYPFYERVPEDIDFKCDGLHDGFYASVAHKCQVYHHCLFGTRYDFLCANYTAFDQKTFICHFASEVDCVNSKKFWHRNDALYKPASTTTTTSRPLVIYTTVPPCSFSPNHTATPVRSRSSTTTAGKKKKTVPETEAARPRPRPVYEDEYEDDRYNRRRPYDRRRKKPEYEDDEEDDYDTDRRRKPHQEEQYSGGRKRRPEPPSRKAHRRPPHEDDSVQADEATHRTRSKTAIYDRPRVAPKVKLPVPKGETDKYAYKSVEASTATQEKKEEEEYYDDDYEEAAPTPVRDTKRHQQTTKPEPVPDDYYDEYEEEVVHQKTPKLTTTTTTTEKIEQPVVRLVKRPFLPSRGGNPYAPRGLQPIGTKAVAKALGEDEISTTNDDFHPQIQRNIAAPKDDPLSINEEEYDVTLNDALSPTLPNLPAQDSFVNVHQRPSGLVPLASSIQNVFQVKQPQQRESFVNQYNGYRPRQVYHHCLFGTRYDFLCANYTAFDQTLFNCNFVSNVDCENSKKYWHRNDELYIEKSTTTAAPALNYNFYTPPPQAQPLTPGPEGYLLSAAVEPPPPRRQTGVRPRATRPPPPPPPPLSRPLYDYYEDYEELPRPKNRKRPRPRPRPVYYDDDYEEYDDVRISRRGGGRRARPYARRERPIRRNKERRKFDYEEEDYDYDDDLVLGKKPKVIRRKPLNDYEYEDDVRYEKRRPANRREKPLRKKRPIDDYDYEEEEEDRLESRKVRDDPKKIPRLGKRRPPSQEFEDDLQLADGRPRKGNKEQSLAKDGRPVIKPVSGTIYDRPRLAPRINLPVPKNAADKFAYKPIGATPTTPAAKQTDEVEYEDYEEAPLQQAPAVKTTKTTSKSVVEEPASTSKENKPAQTATIEEQDYEEEPPKQETSSSTTEPAIDHASMPVIRKFKRPFLPSRGGNPFTARNLQPVGVKAKEESQEIDLGESSLMKSVADPADMKPLPVKVTITTGSEESTLKSALKEEAKPGVIRIKVPIRMKQEDQRTQNVFQNGKYVPESTSTTTQQPKLGKEDVLNGNYDVTINEAISPIIPNLPVRGFGGYNPSPDYSYKRFQRPTKYVILDPV